MRWMPISWGGGAAILFVVGKWCVDVGGRLWEMKFILVIGSGRSIVQVLLSRSFQL